MEILLKWNQFCDVCENFEAQKCLIEKKNKKSMDGWVEDEVENVWIDAWGW